MITTLTIDIDKKDAGVYFAQPHIKGHAFGDGVFYSSVADAIRGAAQDAGPDVACFVQFAYAGLSTGTLAVDEAIRRAPELADRLMDQIAVLHRVIGDS